ncbi:MAG TPA: CHAT domain-containing protein [Coleofasciculaceae cyanobacterium]|jgi:hypothetical protein
MPEKETMSELLLKTALTAIQEIENECNRAEVLATLAPYLPEVLLGNALVMVRRIKDEHKHTALTALTPYLPEALLEQALAMARRIEDSYEHAKALAVIVPRLAELGHLEKALAIANEIKPDCERFEALAALVSQLAELGQLTAGLTILCKIKADKRRTKALVALASKLTQLAQLKKVLNLAYQISNEEQQAEALAALLPYLPEPLQEKALTTARRISTEKLQTHTLRAMASLLPKPLIKKTLVAVQKIKDKDQRSKVQAALANRLAELGVQQEALVTAQNVEAENWRVRAWVGLLPYLPEPLKSLVFNKALITAQNIEADIRRAMALAALVPWLAKFGRVEEALATAEGIEFDYWRRDALTGLAPGVAELEPLELALVAAQKLSSEERANALALLVPRLAKSGRLEDALATAQGIELKNWQAEALAALIPWLAELPSDSRDSLRHYILQKLEEAATERSHIQLLHTLSPVLVALGGVEAVAQAFHLVALELERSPEPSFFGSYGAIKDFSSGVIIGSGGYFAEQSSPVRRKSPHSVKPFPNKQPIKVTLPALVKLVRYPNLDCPDHALVNQKFSLFAQLLIDPPELGIEAVEVEDTDVLEQLPEVEVVLRVRGFDIEDSNTKVTQVKRDDDSEVRFSLIPRRIGEQQIRIDFYQHGRRLGTARHNVLVVEELVNVDLPQVNRPMSIELRTLPASSPPDLELCVELDRHDGRTLYFTLHSTKGAVGYHHTKVGQVTLQGSPLEKMQAVYQEMSRLAAPVKPEEKALAERRLATLGHNLWDELIPDKLKQEYWRFKSYVKTFLITSDEPWVPWEVLKPYRYHNDGEREDNPFWCQQFALSRWLSGPGTTDELLLGAARPVAPNQVNLLSVQEEVAFIRHLHDLHTGITVLEPFSACLDVLDWLETGKFSMLHFACHGMFDATSPDNSAIKLTDGILRPSDIQIRFGGQRPRPLLFINACHGGRSEFSFTGLGGWAEQLVTKARVGAFVGAMWEVNDGLALQFAQRFYTELLKNNETISEAFRKAREEIRQLAPYNSTWLAYALYSDPEGRFKEAQ